jgi:hypothetical protein
MKSLQNIEKIYTILLMKKDGGCIPASYYVSHVALQQVSCKVNMIQV